jgi:hypothetical protein
MILLISSLSKTQECVRVLEDGVQEPVRMCASPREAIASLEAQPFSAVIFDQLLLDSDPDEGRTIIRHLGSAASVYVNFATSGTPRILRELRSALQRRKWELSTAKQQAEQSLRNELNGTVTALLLSCEMALEVSDLPSAAQSKIHEVAALAKAMSARLGAAG